MRPLLIALFLFLAMPAWAAGSPVGLWRLDEAKLEATLDQLIAAILSRLPAEQQANAAEMMVEQREDMKKEMTKSMASTIEFATDGSVIFSEPASLEIQRGTWRLDGERLMVADDDPQSPDLVGAVHPDRIDLSFQVDRNDPDQELLGDLVWVLVPVR